MLNVQITTLFIIIYLQQNCSALNNFDYKQWLITIVGKDTFTIVNMVVTP